MRPASRCAFFLLMLIPLAWAEPLPLKRAVDLALHHSTATAIAEADQQRAFAAYREARNNYIPLLVVGSGLGASYGFPLSLEGAAPSIINLNTQSALINPALRDFVRAAHSEATATGTQNKDQRNQVIQDTVLSYAELDKWSKRLEKLHQEEGDALKAEQAVADRVAEGVDNPLERNKAKLTTARVRLRIAEAQGAADVLRNRLAQLTGLPAASIETTADSMPAFPEVLQEDDLATKAAASNPLVAAAEERVKAFRYRARGEHRALWPSVDFAAQYAVLSRYNNYDQFFSTFQRHNASIGVVMRFPFLNFSQRAHAEAADADVVKAQKTVEATRNQVSEETLKLQRAVQQAAAAREVADLEYQVAQANLDSAQARLDAGTGSFHDLQDARTQANEHYAILQDAIFELAKARVSLLRATGELENWALAGN